jgi:hypothetical protein
MGFTRITSSGELEAALCTFGHIPPDRALVLFDLVREQLGCDGFEAPPWDDGAPPAVYSVELVRQWRTRLAHALAPKPGGERLRAFARATPADYDGLANTLRHEARLTDAFPSLAEHAADHLEILEEDFADATADWPFEYWAKREPATLITTYVEPLLDGQPLSYARSRVDVVDAEYLVMLLDELERDLATCDAQGTALRFAWS